MTTATPTLRRIADAHTKSGAPGRVIGFWGSGHYQVQLQYGQRRFRFHCLTDGRIRVLPSWSIASERQRKQATC